LELSELVRIGTGIGWNW